MYYTYLIGWSKHHKFYYGSRSGRCMENRDPKDDLWVRYYTSSRLVHKYRKEWGDPDVIQIRRTFADPIRCRAWETKVLTRLDCASSDTWLNMCNNTFKPENYSYEDRLVFRELATETCKKRYGVSHPNHVEQFMEKRRQTNVANLGVPYSGMSEEVKAKIEATCMERYGMHSTTQLPHVAEARKRAHIEKFGIDNLFKDMEWQRSKPAPMLNPVHKAKYLKSIENYDYTERNAKTKATNLERYGNVNYLNTEEGKSRRKAKMQAKYGVDCYAATEEYKAKRRRWNLENFGVTNNLNSPELKAKRMSQRLSCHICNNPDKVYMKGNLAQHYAKVHSMTKEEARAVVMERFKFFEEENENGES